MFKLRLNSGNAENFPRILPFKQNKIILSPIDFEKKTNLLTIENNNNNNTNTSSEKFSISNEKLINRSLSLSNRLHNKNSSGGYNYKIQQIKNNLSQTAQLTLTSNQRTKQQKSPSQMSNCGTDSSLSEEQQSSYDCNCILCATNILKRKKHQSSSLSKAAHVDTNWTLDTKKFFNYLDSLKPIVKIDREAHHFHLINNKKSNNYENAVDFIEKKSYNGGSPSFEYQNTRLLSKSSRIKLWNTNETINSTNTTITQSSLQSQSQHNNNKSTITKSKHNSNSNERKAAYNFTKQQSRNNKVVKVKVGENFSSINSAGEVLHQQSNKNKNSNFNQSNYNSSDYNGGKQNEVSNDSWVTTAANEETSGANETSEEYNNFHRNYYYCNPPTTPEPEIVPRIISVQTRPRSQSFRR